MRAKCRKTWACLISIGPYEAKKKMDISTYEVEWEKYPLEDHPVARPLFDNVGIF